MCIRYRRNPEHQRIITTVEVVIDERPMKPKTRPIPPDTILPVKIAYHEEDFRQAVKDAGGKWDVQNNVWRLAYGHIVALELTDRIVTDHG